MRRLARKLSAVHETVKKDTTGGKITFIKINLFLFLNIWQTYYRKKKAERTKG